MFRVWLAFVVIVVIATFGKSKDERRVKCQMLNKTQGYTEMILRCGRNRVIYSVKMLSERIRDTGTSCQGLTSNMLVDLNFCHWKRKCSVQLKNELMVKFQGHNCPARPNVLKLINYACVKGRVVKDMCKNSGTKIAEKRNHKYGVIRSHPCYPWNYDKHSLETVDALTGNCNITLQPVLANSVVIFVDALSIDTDSDSLYAYATRKIDKISPRRVDLSTGKYVFDSGEEVQLVFRINRHYTKGGRGFVLCYKFFSDTAQVPDSLCEKIINLNTKGICRKRKVKKRYRKGRRRQSC